LKDEHKTISRPINQRHLLLCRSSTFLPLISWHIIFAVFPKPILAHELKVFVFFVLFAILLCMIVHCFLPKFISSIEL